MTRINWTRASLNAGSFLAAVIICYGLFVLASEKLPDPPASACNCVGKGPDCYEQDFEFPNGLDAHCAFYGVRANCCEYREAK